MLLWGFDALSVCVFLLVVFLVGRGGGLPGDCGVVWGSCGCGRGGLEDDGGVEVGAVLFSEDMGVFVVGFSESVDV